jgi:F-type H+-transporting ATPase subunit b
MLVDWFTVAAQALNFLVLVWLLKRLLYKPILKAIAAREKQIATTLADADAVQVEAGKERDEFQRKSKELEQQRAALVSKATGDAQAEGQRLLEEARQSAAAWSAKRQETQRADEQNLQEAITRRTLQEVFAIARKALADLASTSLEERMGDVFTRRMQALDAPAKARLADAIKGSPASTVVRSTFDLPAQQRALIQKTVNETLSADIALRFETAPQLVCGIELVSTGQKVSWSIAEYLTSVKAGVDALLKDSQRSQAGSPPKPESPQPQCKSS